MSDEKLLAAIESVFEANLLIQEHNLALVDEQEPIYGHGGAAMITRFVTQTIAKPVQLKSCFRILA